jgi:predicted RNase H-like HicB family nuclease
MQELTVTTQVFKEDDVFVACSPELNVSSFGDTPEQAVDCLREALSLFLKECQRMGTLSEVLEEAGFRLTVKSRKGRREPMERWTPPKPVATRRLEVVFA